MRERRVAVTAALFSLAGSLAIPVAAQAASPTTYHVANGAGSHCSDTTTNSAATPYCTIQAAVDVATVPGDTVIVGAGIYTPFTVTASGTASAPITIEARSQQYTQVTDSTPAVDSEPAVAVSGASYVNIENFTINLQYVESAVQISNSDHVTLDSTDVQGGWAAISVPTVGITSSSYVTISRNSISSRSSVGAVVAQGGSHNVITTNETGGVVGPAIVLNQSTDSAVTSNSVGSTCADAVDVLSGSTSASVENNVVTGGESTDACLSTATTRYGLAVDAASVTGTTADFNNIVPATGGTNIELYSWNGTGYSSPAAFNTATGQAAHDNAAQIDSADSNAPGELSTDEYGHARVDDPYVADTGVGTYAYYDRGATETVDPISVTTAAAWPTTAGLNGAATYSAAVTDSWSTGISGCVYDFGDGTPTTTVSDVNGTCAAPHTYTKSGPYTITLTVVGNDGYQQSSTYGVTVSTDNVLLPAVGFVQQTGRDVTAKNTGRASWNIIECDFNFGDGTAVATDSGSSCNAVHHYASIGKFQVTMTVTYSGGHTASVSAPFTAGGYEYKPVTPIRVLDTRKAIGVPKIAKVAPGGTVKLKLAGVDGVPSGAAAVTLNVTVTNASSGGYVTAYPDGVAKPNASNVNFTQGQTVANLATVKLGSDGYVDLTNSGSGTIDLVADLQGYYTVNGDTYTAVNNGSYEVLKSVAVPAGGTVTMSTSSVSLDSAAAVTLYLNVTHATAGGFITAYPDGSKLPNSSNVNFGTGQTAGNAATVAVGSDGEIDFTNSSSGSVDLSVYVYGGFTSSYGAVYFPVDPTRYLDTRHAIGTFSGDVTSSGLVAYGAGQLEVNGSGVMKGLVPQAATAVAANITVTQPVHSGNLQVGATAGAGAALTTYFQYGQTLATSATLRLSHTGVGGLYLNNQSAGTVQLVVDVNGYYL